MSACSYCGALASRSLARCVNCGAPTDPIEFVRLPPRLPRGRPSWDELNAWIAERNARMVREAQS